MQRTDPGYRPDIDGLRGLAVAGVVLFHLGFWSVSGGYVGVDVFFVISGFLITSHILAELQAGTFSFPRFYARRARRLFPALFVTLVASFIGAACMFTPVHLQQAAESTVYALGSLANVFFWKDSDYFSTAIIFKPLLHTWSLAVEEQFYMLWPCVLFALWRVRRLGLWWPLALITCAASWWLSQHWLSIRENAAAFYLTPSRAFELGLGALCVRLAQVKPRWPWLLEPLFAAGLVAVLWPMVHYMDVTPFPGTHALMPCGGAALLIYAGRAKYLGRLLDNPPAVALGLVSYSLYLVHWPLVVFYRYYVLHPFNTQQRALLFCSALLTAAVMCRFVEQPFRAPPNASDRLSPGQFGLRCVALSLGLAAVAASAWLNIGWSQRFPAELSPLLDQHRLWKERRALVGSQHCDYASSFQTWEQYAAGSTHCMQKHPGQLNILVTGDSHAADLWAAMHLAYPAVNFLQATGSGCRTIAGQSGRRCGGLRARVDDALRRPQGLDGVVLAGDWSGADLPDLSAQLPRLGHQSLPLVLVGPSPAFELEVPVLVARHGTLTGLPAFVHPFEKQERVLLSARMRTLAARAHVAFLDRVDLLCDGGFCPVIDEAKHVLFVDEAHWTVAGAHYAARQLAKKYPNVIDVFKLPN